MLRRIKAQHTETKDDIGFYIQIMVSGQASMLDVFMSLDNFNKVNLLDDIHLTYEDGTVYLLKKVTSVNMREWIMCVESENILSRLELAVLEAANE